MTRFLEQRIVVVALIGGLCGATVWAQSPQPGPPSHDETPVEEPGERGLLAGPKVPLAAYEQANRFLGARRQPKVPLRQWFRVLERLDLSELQEAEIDAIRQDFQGARRAHDRADGQRISELRQLIHQAREAGEEPPLGPQQELTRLTTLGPHAADYQQRIWMRLDESQQAQMRADLKRIRKRIAERRALDRDRMMRDPKRSIDQHKKTLPTGDQADEVKQGRRGPAGAPR
ncbi:MAG: hypothetical protein IH830_10895 [Planctomycetes bacterium]|nr:hypothetical protein [Planctomycetota bacterium]